MRTAAPSFHAWRQRCVCLHCIAAAVDPCDRAHAAWSAAATAAQHAQVLLVNDREDTMPTRHFTRSRSSRGRKLCLFFVLWLRVESTTQSPRGRLKSWASTAVASLFLHTSITILLRATLHCWSLTPTPPDSSGPAAARQDKQAHIGALEPSSGAPGVWCVDEAFGGSPVRVFVAVSVNSCL